MRQVVISGIMYAASFGTASAQGFNIGGMIGGVVQGAIQADQQRQQLEQLKQIEQLRLQQLQYQNSLRQQPPPTTYAPPAFPQQSEVEVGTPAAQAVPDARRYRVDGRALGDVLDQRTLDKDYDCRPSDQFDGFTRCKQTKMVGGVSTYSAILKSAQNAIVYDNKFYASARFQRGAVEGQIQQLSERHHEQARRLTMTPGPDGSGATIASWGALTLVPVDDATISDLAAGRPVSVGFMVDFLSNPGESAKRGLPVYRMQGGAGYYWAARWDAKGAGTLRFGIVNASAFNVPKPQAPLVATAPLRAPAPTEAPSTSSGSTQTAAAEQPRPNTVDDVVKSAQAAGEMVVQSPTPPVIVSPLAASPAVHAATNIADQGNRVALVIGNSAYRSVARLENPSRDAEAVAQTLRDVGFTSVKLIEDATLSEMREALRSFQEQADDADWAMVYYAGHGIEISNQNYLIPVDAKLKSDQDADDEALTLRYVLDKMHNARKLRLVILDACRENPFQSAMKRQVAARSVQRGLAPYEPRMANEMVVYAAKDGEQAQDGDNSGHSPFAKALIARLATPHVEINKVFRLVTADVLAATTNRQQPFVYGSTPGEEDFYFRPN